MQGLNALEIALFVVFVAVLLVLQYFVLGRTGDDADADAPRWVRPVIVVTVAVIVVLVTQLPKRL